MQTQHLLESVTASSESTNLSAETATAIVQLLETDAEAIHHQGHLIQQEANQAKGAATALQNQLQFFQLSSGED